MRLTWLLVGLALVGAPLGTAGGDEVMNHSGTVVAIDAAAGTLTLEEIGPWRVVGGRSVLTRLSIDLTPATRFLVARRDPSAVFPGGFVELLARAGDFVPGDFITVECRHEGRRLIAVTVTGAASDETN